jgi:hypothetical protein
MLEQLKSACTTPTTTNPHRQLAQLAFGTSLPYLTALVLPPPDCAFLWRTENTQPRRICTGGVFAGAVRLRKRRKRRTDKTVVALARRDNTRIKRAVGLPGACGRKWCRRRRHGILGMVKQQTGFLGLYATLRGTVAVAGECT